MERVFYKNLLKYEGIQAHKLRPFYPSRILFC